MSTEDRDLDPVDDTVDTPDGSRSSSSAGASGASAVSPATEEKKRKHLPVWQETILLLGIALVLAVVIKALFVQAFYIPSESMEPGLVENDRILVQKPSYWFGEPQRGDVVVFEDPGSWLSDAEQGEPTNGLTSLMAKIGLYPTGGHLVKRVIGVEGDTITCCDKKGRISVNGKPLNEEGYVQQEKGIDCRGPMTGNCSWSAGPVPEGHLFVMGDNRGHSADSSAHLCLPQETDCTKNPYVPVDSVVGKVFVLLWPTDRFEWVGRPDAFANVPDPS
ncbi:signal peptidase I [Nocardioides sp. zg-579]|uniref:Signal peptidase I n=1 Tax=Nocardioides marmotae TaxID=2663857 RepID=A0A6I3JBD9_9ACTN|nr:signal peptidase I [Nocardioides marmotae]MCR6031790.1 signal peptidase I [Gordonia jinghuaiqii]MTB95430.1 signal peptidase I [Nocardioides marmotae]QKE00870.1 signal peptidase I [Nocardioides marmotae]